MSRKREEKQRLLSISEALEVLPFSRSTLERLIRDKKIEIVYKLGISKRFIAQEEIEKFIN